MKSITLVVAGFLLSSFGNDLPQNSENSYLNIINLNNNKEMSTEKNYTSTILIDKTPTEAFNAIKNFKAWWSEDIEGATDKLGETFFYHYKEVHLCKIKLIEMIPGERLVYHVLANEFSFTKDKSEWVNTNLVFDISTEGTQTKVKFTHEGLVPEYECYNVCHDAWTGFIQKSLKNLINTGKGEPNPKDGTNDINAENIKKWNIKN
ncbi:MAG: SRPBCC domain-containing protein [Ferruginibacter sp.]